MPQPPENAPSRLEEKRADKTERILTASLELFSERGYHATAMPDIASRAGIAPATIYRYFPSKEALVNAVFRAAKSRLRAHLFQALDVSLPPRAIFGAIFQRLVSFARARPADFVFLEMQDHVPYLDKESHAIEASVLSPLGKILEVQRAQGLLGPLRADVIIGMVWGSVVGLIKAERMGYLKLTDADLAGVEQACFQAISAARDGDPSSAKE